MIHAGTTIDDLTAAVERAEQSCAGRHLAQGTGEASAATIDLSSASSPGKRPRRFSWAEDEDAKSLQADLEAAHERYR